MFDKLIESNSVGAEFKPRRKFFMVSSVIVGIVFLSAVVVSLYAQDIDLGTDNFELSTLIAPVPPDAPQPDPPKQQSQPQQDNEQPRTELPSRQQLIERIDRPQQIPTEISTTPFKGMTIPDTAFQLNPNAPEGNGGSREPGSGIAPAGSGSGITDIADATPVKVVEPPPIPPKVEAPKRPVSIGVVNGKALSLPKPQYSAAAISIRAEGEVTVQVTIDEEGKVISAKAISGHPLLKGPSEKAAWNARFTPTLLSKVPVKVTGMIVYKFSRK